MVSAYFLLIKRRERAARMAMMETRAGCWRGKHVAAPCAIYPTFQYVRSSALNITFWRLCNRHAMIMPKSRERHKIIVREHKQAVKRLMLSAGRFGGCACAVLSAIRQHEKAARPKRNAIAVRRNRYSTLNCARNGNVSSPSLPRALFSSMSLRHGAIIFRRIP